jgi:hypothetical protein
MPAEPMEQEGELPPPGNRSGAGAHSVLPYLTRTLQAKPSALASDPHELNARLKSPPAGKQPSVAR